MTADQQQPDQRPVLYVLKRFPRLSETFVLHELLQLRRAGVTVAVDALSTPEPGPRHPGVEELLDVVRYLPRRPRLRGRGVLRTHLHLAGRRPARWCGEALRAARTGQWRRFVQAGLVAARAREIGARHLHAHFATAAAEVAITAGRLAGLPCSVTAHAKDVYHREHAASSIARLARADAVVTVSEHNVRHLRAQLPGVDVHLVRNGVVAGPVADPAASRTLLAVARLVPKKGLDLLVEAVALLQPAHPDLQVELIGDGPLRAELESQITLLGLRGVLRLRGAAVADEVFAGMAAARAVVLPCRIDAHGDRDGLPTVLVEALARAVPVVSTDVVGIGELVRHGRTGLLVPAEDVVALAEALARLLDDPQLACRLGAAGRALVVQEYDPARSAHELARVFTGGPPHRPTRAAGPTPELAADRASAS